MLFSLHLKATMMKVSDPIHVRALRRPVYFRRGLRQARRRPRRHRRQPEQRPRGRPRQARAARRGPGAEIERTSRPATRAGRTWRWSTPQGDHQPARPHDVIIDASMPVVIRDGGKMWNRADELEDASVADPGPLLRRRVPGGDRRLHRPTASSTPRPWAASPTSG